MGDIDGEYGLIKCLVYSKFKLEFWNPLAQGFQLLREIADYPYVQFVGETLSQSSSSSKLLMQKGCNMDFMQASIYDIRTKATSEISTPLMGFTSIDRYIHGEKEVFLVSGTQKARIKRQREDPTKFEDFSRIDYFDPTNLISPKTSKLIGIVQADKSGSTLKFEKLIEGRVETYASVGFFNNGTLNVPLNREKLELQVLSLSGFD